MIALFTLGAALAAPVSVRVCAQYNLQLTDASPAVGDDFLNESGVTKALGVRLRVANASTGAVIFDDFAEDSGTHAGCTASSLTLDSATYYTVRMYTRVRIGTNVVQLIPNGNYSFGPAAKKFPLGGASTYTLTSPVGPQWNIMGVAALALSRHDGNLENETFEFLYQEDYDTNAFTGSFVAIDKQGGLLKYVIAHEMGHMVSARLGGVANNDPSLNVEPCAVLDPNNGEHAWESKEYQSTAYWEGLAHFYAASSFNSESGGDCWFSYYKPTDWNHDGVIDPTRLETDNSVVSCLTGPTYQSATDHLGHFCAGWPSKHVGMEFDWLRFFWDTAANSGMDYEEHAWIYSLSDGPSWDKALPICNTTSQPPSCPDAPTSRLSGAALTSGYGTLWAVMTAIHGVDQ